jgi:hypothetical protein
VIAVSRLGRRAEQRGNQPPDLTDLPEHRVAGPVADLIALLRRSHLAQPWDDAAMAELSVFRLGRPTGVLDLRFEGRYCRFTDCPTPTVDPTGPGGIRSDQRGPPPDRGMRPEEGELLRAAPLPVGGEG